jgi:hypothetical protein
MDVGFDVPMMGTVMEEHGMVGLVWPGLELRYFAWGRFLILSSTLLGPFFLYFFIFDFIFEPFIYLFD